MPSWWGKSSPKAPKKKEIRERFIDTLQRKFKSPDSKSTSISRDPREKSSDTVSERGSQSRAHSRSPSPSKYVARCQSFAERPLPQTLPLPDPANLNHTDARTCEKEKQKLEKGSKPLSFLPLSRPACTRHRLDPSDFDGELVVASISSECSIESDEPVGSHQRSSMASDHDCSGGTSAIGPSSIVVKDQSPVVPLISRETLIPMNVSNNRNAFSPPSRRRPFNSQVLNLQVPPHGTFCSGQDSSMSSPSRSPMRAFGYEQVTRYAFPAGKLYPDIPFPGSCQCSSPGSCQTSGHNSMGGDMVGQLFWHPSRGSPEYSPNPSPRRTSPGPSSRIHSGAVTPLHPRAGGGNSDPQNNWLDDAKQQSHPLPLPPLSISNSSPFSHPNSAVTSPSVPRSPGRAENPMASGPRWKKGKLLGRGTFGHVYVGFNSETGGMCAMKEVTLFADDAKSKESAKQLGQEIMLLSRLSHPNIVQYYGSESVDDKLYIYLEYVSGGSIRKILQDYGKLGESAIRSYTQQILSGLAYLHAKNTLHRDIKGANILVDPSGRVKLADFGMAKHIAGQSCPLSFKGSPYWMAPEVIRNSNSCSLAVDIWSLGCTVLEMATSKPPWSQYEGVAAMFKIGNSKELPTIPDHLSEEGKDFVRLCLQRNPLHRPTASQLLEHVFVKGAAPAKEITTASEYPAGTNIVKSTGTTVPVRSPPQSDMERLAIHSSRISKSNFHSSDSYSPRNISCPVSPVGSPLLHPRSPQHMNGRMSPSPLSSPFTSGSSTPLTGGIGAIPRNFNQSMFLQEGLYDSKRTSYWDPDILRGVYGESNAFQELAACDNDVFKKQFGREANGEFYNGQSVLADRVAQQLLREPVKLSPPLDFNPSSSPACPRTTGI
ncbi:mitogen-activated protein kinase kinase kinase YODA-like [Dorcoceras hygrometricum]|uniref:mitogen-activated protein kinase kinase kinase n=1 Tax=Dorcoceras hygrometricum TaxID=472368 RepID=A0A2Z7C2A4_9LAMI|nr:mitogen-activated protein kinase kinase kinase YODA-like [Dorcoceras hygrometricum]